VPHHVIIVIGRFEMLRQHVRARRDLSGIARGLIPAATMIASKLPPIKIIQYGRLDLWFVPQFACSAIEFAGRSLMAGVFWQLLGDAKYIGARLHLLPNLDRFDADVKPEGDQVVEQVSAFADNAGGMAFDGFDRDLAGLLNHFARKLASAGLQQFVSTRMRDGGDLAERSGKMFEHGRTGICRIFGRDRVRV
jgi:hypothetical protein